MSEIQTNVQAMYKQRLESIVDVAFSQWILNQKSVALLVGDSTEIQAIMMAAKEQATKLQNTVLKSESLLSSLDIDSIIIRRPGDDMDMVIGNADVASTIKPYTFNGVITAPASAIHCEHFDLCYLISSIPIIIKRTNANGMLITIANLNGFVQEISKAGKFKLSVGDQSQVSGKINLDVPSIRLPQNTALYVTGSSIDQTATIVNQRIRYLTITGLFCMVIAILLIYLIVLAKTKQIRQITSAINQYRNDGMQKFMRRLVMRDNILFTDEIDDLYRGMLDMSLEIEKNNMVKAQKIEAELRADNQEKMRIQKEKMLARFARAAEHERAHLAAELHDDIGQQLVKIRIDATMIRSISKGRTKTIAKTDSIIESCSAMHESIRGIIDTLHPHDIDTLGFKQSINELIKTWETRMPAISFDAIITGDVDKLPVAVKTCLYRCTQEALTNIAKYAKPSKVVVTLETDNNVASIQIQDDGIGFNPMVRMTKGRGLRGMKDRVESLSGAFLIRSAQGMGTYIRAHVPVYHDDKKAPVNLSQ